MKVSALMITDVKSCVRYSTLNTAAELMWGFDLGCLPIVDDENRVVGMLTDRDICMSAYLQGVSLRSALVSDAMSKEVYSCRPGDNIKTAEKIMLEKQVHRLPVVDDERRLVGIISINDLARESAHEAELGRPREVAGLEVVDVIAAVCAPRHCAIVAHAA